MKAAKENYGNSEIVKEVIEFIEQESSRPLCQPKKAHDELCNHSRQRQIARDFMPKN